MKILKIYLMVCSFCFLFILLSGGGFMSSEVISSYNNDTTMRTILNGNISTITAVHSSEFKSNNCSNVDEKAGIAITNGVKNYVFLPDKKYIGDYKRLVISEFKISQNYNNEEKEYIDDLKVYINNFLGSVCVLEVEKSQISKYRIYPIDQATFKVEKEFKDKRKLTSLWYKLPIDFITAPLQIVFVVAFKIIFPNGISLIR